MAFVDLKPVGDSDFPVMYSTDEVENKITTLSFVRSLKSYLARGEPQLAKQNQRGVRMRIFRSGQMNHWIQEEPTVKVHFANTVAIFSVKLVKLRRQRQGRLLVTNWKCESSLNGHCLHFFSMFGSWWDAVLVGVAEPLQMAACG